MMAMARVDMSSMLAVLVVLAAAEVDMPSMLEVLVVMSVAELRMPSMLAMMTHSKHLYLRRGRDAVLEE